MCYFTGLVSSWGVPLKTVLENRQHNIWIAAKLASSIGRMKAGRPDNDKLDASGPRRVAIWFEHQSQISVSCKVQRWSGFIVYAIRQWTIFAEFESQTVGKERFKPTTSHSVFPSDSTAMIAPLVISQRDLSPKLTACQNEKHSAPCLSCFGQKNSNYGFGSLFLECWNAPFRFSLYLLGKSSFQPKDERPVQAGAIDFEITSYSSCSRTVDGPSATLFIPDLHCFFPPGPYSFSQDYIFEWVYWLHFYRYFPFHMISPLSFHLVLHLFSNTDLKVMADSSAVPLLQCTVTFPFPTCSRYADFQATYVPNSAMFSTPSRHRFLWTVESSSWNQRWNMDEFYCILIELWMKLT